MHACKAIVYIWINNITQIMKYIALLIIIFPLCLNAQVIKYNHEKYLEFTLQFPQDSASATGIDWNKEKLISQFKLKGKKDLQYSITLVNDTVASLSKYQNGKWEFQGNIQYTDWAVRRIDKSKVISEFKITDFDHDGDEDLLCWVTTNVNGNEWTLIFLNDQANLKLVKLYDTAEETDIWNRPTYNKKTHTIDCALEGSAYGTSWESRYKLNNLTATPISKIMQNRQQEAIIDYDYIGKDGKWKLTRTTTEKFEEEEYAE